MGIASSLFYDPNDSDKQTLHRRIRPSEEQFSDQQERWNALAEFLINDLKERSSYPVRTWLQGSYKFGTQIRPVRKRDEFDIDLGVYFQWKGKPTDGEHTPKTFKSIIQDSLLSYEGDDVLEVISPSKEKCSRINFNENFHIDVPGYHLDHDSDKRALATESNGWEFSDPKALYVWFKNKFDNYNRDKVRRLIQYLKCWAALKFPNATDRPTSTLLTVLVAEAVESISTDQMAADDDAALSVLDEIVDRLDQDRNVSNPVDEGENLAAKFTNSAYEEFIDKLTEFRNVAVDALACNTVLATSDKWAEAFEHFFPMPDSDEIAKSVQSQDLLPVPLTIPEVSVRAVSKSDPHKSRTGMNQIGPIPKDWKIYFEVINPNALPNAAEVEWMVRNEGDEAEETNDLGHKAGVGLKAEESSSYKGTHYMDCIVKQFGQPIGFRRVRVEISGTFSPRRNTNKRQFYKRLPGRR